MRLVRIIFATAMAGLIVGTVSVRAGPITAGDFVITQESPRARQAAGDMTAGAAIFLLKPSGEITAIARPPRVSGPRGIRLDRDGTFVFADPIGASIGRLARDGSVTTLWRGAPLHQPKDVAVDRDGGYLIADFPNFRTKDGARVLKLHPDGRMETLHEGGPLVWPHGIEVDEKGNVVIADHACCIYRLSPNGELNLVAAGGPLVSPQDIKVDRGGSYIVTDIGIVIGPDGKADRTRSRNPGKLLRVSPSGEVAVIARVPRARFRAVAPSVRGEWLVIDMMGDALLEFDSKGNRRTIYQGAPLSQPAGVVHVPN